MHLVYNAIGVCMDSVSKYSIIRHRGCVEVDGWVTRIITEIEQGTVTTDECDMSLCVYRRRLAWFTAYFVPLAFTLQLRPDLYR